MLPELADRRQELQNRIAAVYHERREQAVIRGEQKRARVIAKYPELREADRRLREAGTRQLSAALKGPENAQAAFAELREARHERLEILKRLGYGAEFDEPDYSCLWCQDTGQAGDERCRCYPETAYPILLKESGLENLSNHRFDCFRTDMFSDKPIAPSKGKTSPRDLQEQLRQTMETYCAQFGEGETKNFFFFGATGTGKTFMAACVGDALLRKGHSVLYLTAGELFTGLQQYRVLSASYSPDPVRLEQAERFYQQIHETELLILDDLGSEVGDSGTRLSELLTLLNARLGKQKACLITTNLDMKQMRQIYDERLTSRILGNFQIYPFYGDDVRTRKLK